MSSQDTSLGAADAPSGPPSILAVQEYASLRQEILERIKFQHQIRGVALLVFGAVLAAGTNRDGIELVLLVW